MHTWRTQGRPLLGFLGFGAGSIRPTFLGVWLLSQSLLDFLKAGHFIDNQPGVIDFFGDFERLSFILFNLTKETGSSFFDFGQDRTGNIVLCGVFTSRRVLLLVLLDDLPEAEIAWIVQNRLSSTKQNIIILQGRHVTFLVVCHGVGVGVRFNDEHSECFRACLLWSTKASGQRESKLNKHCRASWETGLRLQ